MIEAAHDELVRAAVLAPVELGGADERLWLDSDLASLAENRLDDRTDPHVLDEARRADWCARATSEGPRRSAAGTYDRCYWILEEGERVGTVALATTTLGSACARIASFYVFPAHRHGGVGRRALDRLEEVLGRHGLGLRLDTCWSWQRTVRFYLRAGMWVYMWKRDLGLFWSARTPRPTIAIDEREASLSVPRGGEPVVLVRARRRGEVLELDEPPKELASAKDLGEAWWLATSTLALALALEGWPLVRSPEEWERSRHADGGPPEALAYKISLWEAWDRHRGWRVETPQIPGLSYPTWSELEARWDAQHAAFEAEMQRTGGVVAPRSSR